MPTSASVATAAANIILRREPRGELGLELRVVDKWFMSYFFPLLSDLFCGFGSLIPGGAPIASPDLCSPGVGEAAGLLLSLPLLLLLPALPFMNWPMASSSTNDDSVCVIVPPSLSGSPPPIEIETYLSPMMPLVLIDAIASSSIMIPSWTCKVTCAFILLGQCYG